MISALQCIRMHNPQLPVKNHSSATLLRDIFVPISSFHMLSRKDALLKLEIYAVLAEDLREELALNLFHEFIDGVSEGEVTLVSGVRVQIQIHKQSSFGVIILTQSFDCVTRGLFLLVGSAIVTV